MKRFRRDSGGDNRTNPDEFTNKLKEVHNIEQVVTHVEDLINKINVLQIDNVKFFAPIGYIDPVSGIQQDQDIVNKYFE